MDENRLEGTARDVGGKIESNIGKLTGDAKLQAEGAIDKAAGTAQRGLGQAADTVRDGYNQASDAVRGAASQASDYGSQLLDQVEEAGDYLAEQIDSRPVLAVLIAAGVGFLIALATKPAPRVVYRRR